MRFPASWLWSRRLTEPPRPAAVRERGGGCEGGGFSERSPSLALSPEERRGIGLTLPTSLRVPASWARFPTNWLWSRRLTEPPRPAYARERKKLQRMRNLISTVNDNASCAVAEGNQQPHPKAARPRRLCQPPGTQPPSSKSLHLSGGTPSEEAHNSNASCSSEERGLGGEAASLREAASPPSVPLPRNH